MRDKNVLGFNSIPQPTYKDKELRRAVALDKAKAAIFVLADILDFSRLPDEQLVEILKCRVSEYIDIL
ncbi:MAG: hypothetical protein WCD89_04795 [Anaerocolumna sp.]